MCLLRLSECCCESRRAILRAAALRDERSCERAALRSERSSERVLLNAVAASQVRCSDLLSFEDDNVMYMQSADYTYTLCALLYVTPVGMKYVCNGCRYGI